MNLDWIKLLLYAKRIVYVFLNFTELGLNYGKKKKKKKTYHIIDTNTNKNQLLLIRISLSVWSCVETGDRLKLIIKS